MDKAEIHDGPLLGATGVQLQQNGFLRRILTASLLLAVVLGSVLGFLWPSCAKHSDGRVMISEPWDFYSMNDGYRMPEIGLGTYLMPPGNDTYSSVLAALKLGYRMIDTAEYYQNEADVGRAVRDSGIPRSEIFITTKISFGIHQYDHAIQAGIDSNEKLGLDYIDLLLIHSPGGGKIVECYDALLHLRSLGVTRSVGVSNFAIKHLQALQTYCRPTPAVNQIELHPLNFQTRRDLVDYCKESGILVQAYGSVLRGRQDLLTLSQSIASSHNKTQAQVMLRWALDKGFQVIPKTTHMKYLAENLDVFDFSLTAEQRAKLDSLPQTQIYGGYNPDSTPIGIGDLRHGIGCQVSM